MSDWANEPRSPIRERIAASCSTDRETGRFEDLGDQLAGRVCFAVPAEPAERLSRDGGLKCLDAWRLGEADQGPRVVHLCLFRYRQRRRRP